MACEPTVTPDNIDIEALKARYKKERDKRIRTDGLQQYVEAAGDLSDYYEGDPFCDRTARAPVDADCEVALLGGGFAGLITAARLKEAGVDDLRIIDMAGDLGGTWYWNRYPGIQ